MDDNELSPVSSNSPVSDNTSLIPVVKKVVGNPRKGVTGLEVERKRGTGLDLPMHRFDPKRFLALAPAHWPNVSKIVRALGFTPQCYYLRLKRDPKFAEAIELLHKAHCDRLEQVLYERGASGDDYTFNDRIAYLRAHRPELYNPAKTIILKGDGTTYSDAKARLQVATQAVDAEIVESYKKRKKG